MTSPPAVSVILPTFNRRAVLGRALHSVLDQSFSDLELLVMDDGSTDGTSDLLAAVSDPRLKVISSGRNRGQSAARNHGLRLARGRLIAFQDSDDEWLPEKLTRQVDLLQRRPEVALVYGHLLRIPLHGPPFVIEAPALVKGRLFDQRPSGYASYGLGIQTCLFRAAALRRLGPFDERLQCFEDLDLFLRFNQRFASCRMDQPLVRYYEGDGVSKDAEREYAARARLLRRYGWPLLRQRPAWLWRELRNIRQRRRLDR